MESSSGHKGQATHLYKNKIKYSLKKCSHASFWPLKYKKNNIVQNAFMKLLMEAMTFDAMQRSH